MKSMVHLGARLGLVGSAIMGSSYRQYAGFTLPQEQILQKLGPVPVFTITDNKGAPLVASNQIGKTKDRSQAFYQSKDAQAFVAQLKTKNQFGESVR